MKYPPHRGSERGAESGIADTKQTDTCANFPATASPKYRKFPEWALSAISRGRKRPITLPRLPKFMGDGDE
jgi:hypothetical protein